MEYFETLGPDGRVYLHYDRWQQWRNDRMREYPQYPRAFRRYRIDIELVHPRQSLAEVPLQHLTNSNICYYESDDWSTIYGVHDAHAYETEEQSWRMLVESGNDDPLWGEPITLFGTSGYIHDEPWGRNPANRFAYFRGMFWQVRWCEFLQPWSPGYNRPLSNFRPHWMRRQRPYATQRDNVGNELMREPFVEPPLRYARPTLLDLWEPAIIPRVNINIDEDWIRRGIRRANNIYEVWGLGGKVEKIDWKKWGF
jgi:hypothetical protein